ncbi:MAG: DUF262 domain-containing protein [Chloroflexota bacterium]|nr:DUF262 domain-containing protein [Chloroflexota bacterium]
MQLIPTNKTVADFCAELDSNVTIVNREYQRNDQVWPPSAQSFLIETILLGYPVPKLALYQKTDRVSRRTVNEIVDGQQRTAAIKAFYDNELRLTKNLEVCAEAAGCRYDDLSEDLQARFLGYGLGFDLFVGATNDEVREVFRRINSYEVPLNPEEQRHARWQGEFKWYIYHLSTRLDDAMLAIGTFKEKQLVRMQDMKLLTEVSHALVRGISTTNKASLDALYRDYDRRFDASEDFTKRIEGAFDDVLNLPEIHGTGLTKAYALYSLLLALIHASEPVSTLQPVATGGAPIAPKLDIRRRLSLLVEAVESRDEAGEFGEFVRATTSRTNVRDQRETRFRYFIDAQRLDGGTRFAGI